MMKCEIIKLIISPTYYYGSILKIGLENNIELKQIIQTGR